MVEECRNCGADFRNKGAVDYRETVTDKEGRHIETNYAAHLVGSEVFLESAGASYDVTGTGLPDTRTYCNACGDETVSYETVRRVR